MSNRDLLSRMLVIQPPVSAVVNCCLDWEALLQRWPMLETQCPPCPDMTTASIRPSFQMYWMP